MNSKVAYFRKASGPSSSTVKTVRRSKDAHEVTEAMTLSQNKTKRKTGAFWCTKLGF